MDTQLAQAIENIGFTDAEAFVRWQFTRYLLLQIAELDAQCEFFRQKYQSDFETFDKNFDKRPEIFEEWDDNIEWTGLEAGLAHTKQTLADLVARGQAIFDKQQILSTTNFVVKYHRKIEEKHANEQ